MPRKLTGDDVTALREILEFHADEDGFEKLFDVQWDDMGAFYKAACDYVDEENQADLYDELRAEFYQPGDIMR